MRRNLKIIAVIAANAILGYILSKFTVYTSFGVLIKRSNDYFLGTVNKLLLYFIAVDWIFEMSHISLMLKSQNIQIVQLFFVWLWTKFCMGHFTNLNTKMSPPHMTEIAVKALYGKLTNDEKENFGQIRDMQEQL